MRNWRTTALRMARCGAFAALIGLISFGYAIEGDMAVDLTWLLVPGLTMTALGTATYLLSFLEEGRRSATKPPSPKPVF